MDQRNTTNEGANIMARIQHDEEWHARELVYIATAWPKEKASFNGNQRVFNEYIEMQAEGAKNDGFKGIAAAMLACRVFVPHSN